jgi:PAS domain S-box-containing protein
MRFRIPFIKSVSSTILFTVILALIIFSYGVILYTKQAKDTLRKQYSKCILQKKKWIDEIVFNKLNSAIYNTILSGASDAGTSSETVELCSYMMQEGGTCVVKSTGNFFLATELENAIRSFVLQDSFAADTIFYSINKFHTDFYFTANKSTLRNPGEITGVLAVSKIPIDSILVSISDIVCPNIYTALLFRNTLFQPAGSFSCFENEMNYIVVSNCDQRYFRCRHENESEEFLWIQTELRNEIRLILVFKPDTIRFNTIGLLIASYLLLLAGIIIFPVMERKRNQKQIGEINKVVQQISQKEFNEVLSEDYPGELGMLARSLNTMSTQLKEMYHDLEIRVIRRTSEISIRNADLRKNQREILQQHQELKSAYEALKESREKYEKLIEHLEDEYYFYTKALNDTLLFVSPSVKKILGYEVKDYRKVHNQIYTENPINIYARESEEKLKLGIPQPKYLKEILDVNQHEKVLEVSEVPVFNDEGQLVSVEGLAHDITEKQRAEELIKEQEEKYRMLFTHASDFIFLYKLDRKNNRVGNFIEVNFYTLNKLGYTLDELREMSPMNLIAEETDSDTNDTPKELASDDQIFECIWKSKDGTMFDVEISTHAFKIKDKDVAIAVGRDITERKKAEEEIRFINEELVNQKENLESLVDNLTETREQLVQSEKMAALGQLIAGIAHEINTPLGAIKASIGNMLDSLHVALSELPELFQKQSAENLFLFNTIFEQAQLKKPELTSREKRQKRRELSALLKEQRINDAELVADALVYLEIYEMNPEMLSYLEKTDALKVVRSARNFISLMKNTNTINLAVEKATKVVFALKKYAHRDIAGEKISTDITDSIETVLTLYHNQLKQGIEIVKNYDQLPLVPCYQDEISQVWTNLIQNAVQAMHFEGTLIITTKNEGNYISVSFKDNGPGVEPDIRDKIFEPFYTTKKQGEGSGLGLDIVRQIVEKHNGIIELESKLGEGANFIVKLPLEQEDE